MSKGQLDPFTLLHGSESAKIVWSDGSLGSYPP